VDKILVVRLSSLGDILLTTPAVRVLAKRFPSAKIDFLVKEQYAPLLDRNPYLRNVIKLDQGDLPELLALRNRIRKEYDLVVDLHANLRSRVMTPFFGGPRVVRFRKHSLSRLLLVKFKFNLLKNNPSVAERYIRALEKFGVKDDGLGLDFFSGESAVIRAKDLLHTLRFQEKEAVVLAPGAKWPTKQWPLRKFVELCNLLPGQRFIVMGEEREKGLGEEIERALPGRVASLAGQTDFQVAGEILRRCKALVTNDSGLMHLGCAVKIPVVAMFGSTCREFGFFPFRARSIVKEKELPCRPCTAIGKRACKLGTLECLEGISAEEVAAAVRTLTL
jgi:lipopolysaccharide heptosyltransferase II